ncbi:MAG: STAS domain-containing protein [Planctomycetota bacterium]|jgi:anti-sigma B factor antagonist
MSTSASNLAVHTMAGAHVVEFTRADLTDAALIKTIGDDIYHVVRRLDQPKVVVDFQNVERLSSATLGMLVALDKVITKQSGQLRIANVREDVLDIFKITKLDDVMPIRNSTQEAVDSFA